MNQSSRWGPIAGFALVASANQMLWLNFAPITTGAATRLGVSKSAIGTLSEIFPLLYVVLAVPVGRSLDRWFGPTLLAGAVLTTGGAVIRVAGHGYNWILAGQIVIAVSQPALLNAITGIASRYLTSAHRPVGIAVGSGGTFVGFIVAFVLGGVLGASRLHTVLLIGAIYAGVSLLVLVAAISRPTPTRDLAPDLSSGSMRELWADPALRALSVLVFLGFGVFIALTTWVETLLKPAGVSSSTTDTLLTVMVVAGVIGCVVIPPIAAGRSLQPHVIAASAAAIVVACISLAVAPGVVAASVALTLVGLLVLPDLPVILEMAERRAGPAGGTATAILWLAGNAGGIIVALVVQGLQSSPATAFAVLAAVGAAALPACVYLKRFVAADGTGHPDPSSVPAAARARSRR